MASGRITKVKGKVLDIPNPPTIGTATAGGESVSIAFTADSSGKGGPTRSYIAKSNPGNITATGSTSPINVTGLTVGTSYTVSVAGVNETGTSEYSSASNSAIPIVGSSYESIATITVGSGGQTGVTFSSIPSTFTHLQIRCFTRDDRPGTNINNLHLEINGDTTTNYGSHSIRATGSSLLATGDASQPAIDVTLEPGATATANVFAGTIYDILDYTNTNKYKTVRSLGGYDLNGAGWVVFQSGLWRSTNAINSIKLYCSSTRAFVQYSHFALYGIKGA